MGGCAALRARPPNQARSRSPAPRGHSRGRSHRVLGGTGRRRLPGRHGSGRGQGRVHSAPGRDALRRRCSQRGNLGMVPGFSRGQSGQARHHAKTRQRRGHGPGAAHDRGCRRLDREFLRPGTRKFRPGLGRSSGDQSKNHHGPDAGLWPRGPLAGPRRIRDDRRAGERSRLADGLPGPSPCGARRMRSHRWDARGLCTDDGPGTPTANRRRTARRGSPGGGGNQYRRRAGHGIRRVRETADP